MSEVRQDRLTRDIALGGATSDRRSYHEDPNGFTHGPLYPARGQAVASEPVGRSGGGEEHWSWTSSSCAASKVR